MSATPSYSATPLGGWHPLVMSRRIRNLLAVSAGGLIAAVIALSVAVAMPQPNPVLVFAIIVGVGAILSLALSPRYEVTVGLLALYLGLLDGPVKLDLNTQVASGFRNVLIIAVAAGMILRLAVRRQRVTLPPLSGWVLPFAAFVLIEPLNPNTGGILKSLGGYRQELEWVPFFFFGYLVIRSKKRFRQLFLILGVIALANGVVGAVQARLSPGQLAHWGPGYSNLINGGPGGFSGRTYVSEGVARLRPPALGSDSGFGGGVGVVALPGLLALLGSGRLRRRWPVLLCCAGALLGIATSASRTSVVDAVIVLLSFVLLSQVARLRISRSLAGLVLVAVLTIGIGSALVAIDGAGVFGREKSLVSVQRIQETGANGKEQSLAAIPHDLASAPFGFGLGTGGSVGGFGGGTHVKLEGQKVPSGSAYNLLTKELGIPGLLLWSGLSVSVIVLALSLLRSMADPELRSYLAAVLAAFVALTMEGFSGPTLAVTIGVYLWFAAGIVAYWYGKHRSEASLAMTKVAT
jgi:hypothetical protein